MKKVELNIAEWRAEYKSSRKHQNKYSEDEFVMRRNVYKIGGNK